MTNESDSLRISIKWVIGTCILLVLISIFQDYYQSIRNRSAFYISESILFNSFWLFFIPGLHVLLLVLKKLPKSVWYLYVGCIVGVLLFHWSLYAVVIYGISSLFYENPYSLLHTMKYSVSTLSLSTLLVYGIGTVLFLRRPAQPVEYQSRIQIKTGSQTIPVDVGDIVFFQAESPYVAIHTFQKQYLHNETLKSLQKQLNPDLFVRIHKSCMINIAHVKSYSSRKNGDYDVVMANDTTVRASRNYAATLKSLL